jgi:hypothetical protein
MIAYLYFAVAVVGAGVHLAVSRPRTLHRASGIMLVWAFAVLVGATGIIGAGSHVFAADQTARQIGWAPGSPFQFENAMGDLAFGVLGLLCIWLRGGFWIATAIGFSIQLLGDAYGHIYQLVVHGDTAPDNIGGILYSDIAFPIILLGLLALYLWSGRAAASRPGGEPTLGGEPVR